MSSTEETELSFSHRSQDLVVYLKILAKEVSCLSVTTDCRPLMLSGKTRKNVSTWVWRFETVSAAPEWDRAQMLLQVGVYLASFALSWYNRLTKDGTTSYTSWDNFKKEITARLQSADYRAQLKRLGFLWPVRPRNGKQWHHWSFNERPVPGSHDAFTRCPHQGTDGIFSDRQKALMSLRKKSKMQTEKCQSFSNYNSGKTWKGGDMGETHTVNDEGVSAVVDTKGIEPEVTCSLPDLMYAVIKHTLKCGPHMTTTEAETLFIEPELPVVKLDWVEAVPMMTVIGLALSIPYRGTTNRTHTSH